jgi:peptidoglycan-associated lipoprotein
MQRKWWIVLALVLLMPGMLTMVSCATQSGGQQTTTQTPAPAPAPAPAKGPDMQAQAAQRAAEMARNQFLNDHVYFDFDSALLTPMAQEVVKQKAAWLKDNAAAAVTLEGNCDERGTNEYNLALGERRAESVRAFLVDLGIAPSRLTTISYGEERPADPGHNEEAWAKNRRVQFTLQ